MKLIVPILEEPVSFNQHNREGSQSTLQRFHEMF
jgi:hypothetical protein